MLTSAISFGIASGVLIALGAVGLTTQFGVSGVLNVAYGSLLTVGAYVGYLFVSQGIDVWIALALTAPVIGVASVCLNRVLTAPLQNRGANSLVVITSTLYAATIIEYVIVLIAGTSSITYGQEGGSTIRALGFVFTSSQIILICLTVVLMLGFHLLLTRTTLGRALRATAVNRNLARACGIRTTRIIDFTWFVTGAMCGIAGVALAITVVSFDFTVGMTFLLYMLAATMLGGAGQPYGAMVGGLIVGLATQITAAYSNPVLADAAAFALLIVILIARPRGLFGAATAGAGSTALDG